MEQKERHKRDLLRRWINGSITAKEEAELRQTAKDDDFLRDAFAGYQQQADQDHAASLERLRKRTTTRASARVRNLAVWRVAAAVLLLLVAAWWLLPTNEFQADTAPLAAERQMTKDVADEVEESVASEEISERLREDQLAAAEPTEAPLATPSPSPPATSTPSAVAQADEATSLADAATEPVPATGLALEEATGRSAFAIDDTVGGVMVDEVFAEAESGYEADAVDLTVTGADDEAIAVSPPPPPVASSPNFPVQNQGYPSRLQDRMSATNAGPPVAREGLRIIEGKVLDSEGYPIIGATLLEEGTANGTVTDFDGFYRIAVAEDDASLVVSYIGYETQLATITDSDELDIVIKENQLALDEVVVTGYGQKRRQERANSAGNVEPIDGFRALRRYINDQTPINTPRSRIRLQFIVQADGTLTDFEVLNSTNTAFNSFAIELIQNGPKWQIVEGDAPVQAVYVVNLKG